MLTTFHGIWTRIAEVGIWGLWEKVGRCIEQRVNDCQGVQYVCMPVCVCVCVCVCEHPTRMSEQSLNIRPLEQLIRQYFGRASVP